MSGVIGNFGNSNAWGNWPNKKKAESSGSHKVHGEISGLQKQSNGGEIQRNGEPLSPYYGREYYANIHFNKNTEKMDEFDRETFLNNLRWLNKKD